MKSRIFQSTIFPVLGVTALLSFPLAGFSGPTAFPQKKSGLSLTPENWPSDQMDIEYPFWDQPHAVPGSDDGLLDGTTTERPSLTATWPSDQIDIEYPFPEQPDTSSDLGPRQQPSIDRSRMITTWQSDQMDIEYPFHEQAGIGTTMKHWTADDHMMAAGRLEEEARLLRAEITGLEGTIKSLLSRHEVDTVRQTKLIQLLAKKERMAEKKTVIAEFHRMSGMGLMNEPDAEAISYGSDRPTQDTSSATKSSREYSWAEEEFGVE